MLSLLIHFLGYVFDMLQYFEKILPSVESLFIDLSYKMRYFASVVGPAGGL